MQWELRVRHNERFICTHCPGKGEILRQAQIQSHKGETGTDYYAQEYILLRKLQQDTYSVLTVAKTLANNFHLMKLIRPSRGIRVLCPLRRSRVWTDYAVAQLKTVHFLLFFFWHWMLASLKVQGMFDKQCSAVTQPYPHLGQLTGKRWLLRPTFSDMWVNWTKPFDSVYG